MALILLQMFIAILDGHYIDLEMSSNEPFEREDNFGFFHWMNLILKEESVKTLAKLNEVI